MRERERERDDDCAVVVRRNGVDVVLACSSHSLALSIADSLTLALSHSLTLSLSHSLTLSLSPSLTLSLSLIHAPSRRGPACLLLSCSSSLLFSLELSDTKVYEPEMRALSGTASHFCKLSHRPSRRGAPCLLQTHRRTIPLV